MFLCAKILLKKDSNMLNMIIHAFSDYMKILNNN